MSIERHNFILVSDADLSTNMPAHFTPRYGVLNPETERMNMRTWGELIADPAYIQTYGATPKLLIEGVTYNLISIELSPKSGDFAYDAAFKLGENRQAPDGLVLSFSEGKEYYNQYKQTEIFNN